MLKADDSSTQTLYNSLEQHATTLYQQVLKYANTDMSLEFPLRRYGAVVTESLWPPTGVCYVCI